MRVNTADNTVYGDRPVAPDDIHVNVSVPSRVEPLTRSSSNDRTGFYIKGIQGHDGSLKNAPENADSIAWAALVLGMNGREFHIPTEVEVRWFCSGR